MPQLPIPFNIPNHIGTELAALSDVFKHGKLSGDGYFSRLCQQWFRDRYGFPQALLTTSCTDALEMSAILSRVHEGDEVIAPSYTFVSTVNAFALRGAVIRFADSLSYHPNINLEHAESLITPRTRALVVVHYAGMACDMDHAMDICRRHNLLLIEDAAQAIDAFYHDRPLGTFGDYATFSFHDTKNITSGEGGLLVVNRAADQQRAEIVREKGTNRSAFLRGEIDKYTWVDIGSSFLPSEFNAAVLWAQLQAIESTQKHRLTLWQHYFDGLADLESRGLIKRPHCPEGARHNAHAFYLIAPDEKRRNEWASHLKQEGIHTTPHYISLHQSPYYTERYSGQPLPYSDHYTQTLLRLPLYSALTLKSVNYILDVFHRIVLNP